MSGQVFFSVPSLMNMNVGLIPGVIALGGLAIAGVAVSQLTGKLAHLAAEQAASRRVAILVAPLVPEQEPLVAAAEEAGRLMGADCVCIGRYESGDIAGVASRTRTIGRCPSWRPV